MVSENGNQWGQTRLIYPGVKGGTVLLVSAHHYSYRVYGGAINW